MCRVERLTKAIIGTVHHGINVVSKLDVAIKLEATDTEYSHLEHEYQVYRNLAGGIGIPTVYWFGSECDHDVMVLEHLGPSLGNLFDRYHHKFTLSTVLLLADQLVSVRDCFNCKEGAPLILTTQISCIEYVHSRHFIHGDIKPSNILMGVGDHDDQVYMIDFGLATRYRDPKTRLPIPCETNCDITGTASYASINNHRGISPSRRDDLESIAYVLLFFMRGSLPWHGIEPAVNDQQRDTILQTKLNTSIEILCSTCPIEFNVFLSYIRTLSFEDKPDYAYIRKLFRDVFVREGCHQGHPFVGYNGANKQNPTVRTGTKYSGSRAKERGAQPTSGRM
jgi:casein kinase I homolog HRR25